MTDLKTDLFERSSSHHFTVHGEGHYTLVAEDLNIELDVDRLWRDKHELCGELSVYCGIAGAKTVDGCLSRGNFNLSSLPTRKSLANSLSDRSKTSGIIDWHSLLDELCIRIGNAERQGQPAKLLSEYERPDADDTYDINGLTIVKKHPQIFFGDGGTFKSYIGLYIAGMLAMDNVTVLYADWELSGSDHRDRLERMFGPSMPDVHYARCERPMVAEGDRLRRLIAEYGVTFVVCDSVAYASNGAPESAEVATEYFRAVRQFGAGIGSLHIAHVTKQKDDYQSSHVGLKPFGCHSDDTDVLTDEGWIAHADVTVDHRVGCFHPESGKTLFLHPEVIHRYHYDGEMVEIAGASMNFLVTPNHRMVVKKPTSHGSWSQSWRFIEAGDLSGTTVSIPTASNVIVNCVDHGRGEHFPTFLGWWIAEGCLNDWAPVLTQVDGPLAKRMCDVVNAMGYEANKWVGVAKGREQDEQPCMQLRLRNAIELGKWLGEHAGIGAKHKRIPIEAFSWPDSDRQKLLTALMEGDGHWKSPTSGLYTTVSRQLADDVQRLAILDGWTARIRDEQTRYTVLLGRRSTMQIRSSRHVSRVPYRGDVHCLTVPTGAYITRRKGMVGISGNSTFWHNSARATWYVRRADGSDERTIDIALYNQKMNLGAMRKAVGFRIQFGDEATTITPSEVREHAELSQGLSLRDRIYGLLRHSPAMTAKDIADELGEKPGTVDTTLRRNKGTTFAQITGERVHKWAIVSKRSPE